MQKRELGPRLAVVASELTLAMVVVEGLGGSLASSERTTLAALIAATLVAGNLLFDALCWVRRAAE